METFDKSKRKLYILSKEEFVKQTAPVIDKLLIQDVTSKFNDLNLELSHLKSKLENMVLIPDFDWDASVAKIDQLEREITRMVNIAMATKEQGKTK